MNPTLYSIFRTKKDKEKRENMYMVLNVAAGKKALLWTQKKSDTFWLPLRKYIKKEGM